MKKETFDAAFEQIRMAQILLNSNYSTQDKVDFIAIRGVLNSLKTALTQSDLVQIKNAIKKPEIGMYGVEREQFIEFETNLNFQKELDKLNAIALHIAEAITNLDTDEVACNFLCRIRESPRVTTTILIQFDFVSQNIER